MPDVLLMAYGTPYREEEIEPYYTDIRGGKPPPPELLEELVERYRLIGMSPLNEITFRQAEELQSALGDESRVWVGMKHWKPWIRNAIAEMASAGVERAVGIVAAPHYSHMSIGGYITRAQKALEATGNPFRMTYVKHYHDHPLYIEALSHRLEATLRQFEHPGEVFVLYTAHSLPQRIAETDDPYPDQLRETARLVSKKLGIENWDTAYQSAGRTPEPWLEPDILQALEEIADRGHDAVAVAAVGFPSDHLEVYYDINHEARQKAEEHGIALRRVPSLNADSDYIRLLKALVEEKWTSWSLEA